MMGGLLQFFDFSQSIMSRKFLMHKKNNDGFEAPRNSLEFPKEASHSNHDIPEDIPYSFQVKHHPAKMNYFPNGVPVEKMIDQEMSTRKNDRCNRPGIVARLMGMDSLPSEIKPMSYARDRKDEKTMPRQETNEIVPTHKTSLISTPLKQTKQEIHPYDIEQDFTRSIKTLNLRKPQSREHPQEEELQKFKREFEAWQSSRIWEHSRTLELGNDLEQGNMQVLAQGNLNREKMASFMDSKRKLSFKETTKPKEYGSTAKLKKDMLHGVVPTNEGVMTKRSRASLRNDIALRKSAKTNLAHIPLANFDNKMDRSSSPAKIVILKPCSERSDDTEESLVSSPEKIEKENNMQDFLEEVRKRLNFEIRGKSRQDKTARWTHVDTCSRERLIDPKQIARDIAKQIRETVAYDFRTTLVWSDSAGSYRSKALFSGPSSSAFFKSDTRKLSSDRQKNVDGRPGTSVSRKEAMRLRPTYDLPKKDKKEICWEDKRALTETETRCFRHENEKSVAFDYEAVSPRYLLRSHSAPVSGTAFRKHRLEDQHLSSGAHNCRKLEAYVPTSEEGRRNKKNGFDFKGRVSNFKGKFFGKKIHSMDEMAEDNIPYMKSVVTAPSVVLNIGIAQENSTEVPPSPVSVSSSSLDEIFRPGYPSPVSPLGGPFTEDCSSSQVFGELSSELPEMKNLLEQGKKNAPEKVATEERPDQDEAVEAEEPAKAYIRDVLVTAGLYEGQCYDQVFSRWTPLTKPISQWVFEKVEELYDNCKVNDGESLLYNGDTNVGHKMLFDLINEALPRVFQTTMTSSTFKTWVLGPKRLPHGKKLLDDLWRQIERHTNPQRDASYSPDNLVAGDLSMTPWSGLLHEDIDVMEMEIECIILRELIDEFVWDICSYI
ncbi:uncharacterized protein [Elaeis guineensis]|uniref:Uncharacterized protein LOC105042669 n=1 Tax=Elaeis guineensis var. tenera TaxID=51953 RepID=A0A6I9R1Z9_ELAGV|nr:uncharacterized protein LOC105042669 [Elaeis guineensis]XP_019705264.1 uncharacterized protein LOC105042669 [Elaeis guineensis]